MLKTSKVKETLRKAAMTIPLTMLLVAGTIAVARADQESGKGKCLWVNRIDHTQVLNDHQILFYEVGGKIWQSNLPVPCRTLTAQDGFSWQSGIPEICGNVEQIRVLRTGEACLLGAFEPYKPGGANPVGTTAPSTERFMKPN